jgi:hypothetical protein
MSQGPSTFRLTDVKRAVQACRNAGLTIGRVEVDREGKIVIVPGNAEPVASDDGRPNSFDKVLGAG